MSSLLELVRKSSPEGLLEPAIEEILDAIDAPAAVASLESAAVDVGTATADHLKALIGDLLPLPLDGLAIPTALPPLPVTARTVGQGWEVVISVPTPAIELVVPGLDAGKLDGVGTEARVVKAGGDLKVVVTPDGGAGVRVVLAAPNGSDVTVSISGASISLSPRFVALPAGFGLEIGALRLSAQGVELPDLGFYLPRIPRLPVGRIDAPLTFGLPDAPDPGVRLKALRNLPFPDAPSPASLGLFVERPSATTILDLVPTKVSFSLPLDGGDFEIDASHPVDPAATGGGELRIRGELGVTEGTATLHAHLEGAGGDAGLATVGGPALALAAAIAPHLLPPSDQDAAATAIIAAAGAGQLLGAEGDGDVVIHGLTFDAVWDVADAAPPSLKVRLDYESRLGIDVSAGSMRVRYRDVAVTTDLPPLLSWQDAPMTIVSPGDWEVKGIPEDLLRIGDIRTGKGSLIVDIDLQTAVSLGVVTVESTTVRIEIDESPTVAPAGFGIGVKIPGVLEGHGQLVFPPDGGFGAALDVKLPTLGASGRAVVAIGDPLVVVAFEARLFAPIPFANSGLGLFGMSGALASGAERVLPNEPDPIIREVRWTPFNPTAWTNGSNVFVGIGAEIGTVPDMGFAFSSKAGILVGVPDPLFRISLEAQLLRGTAGQLTGVLVVTDREVTAGLVGEYEIPVLLTAHVPAGARFPITDPSSWEARLGGDGEADRSGPVTIHILPDLLDLDAWAFVMAFGDASTTVGAKLAPPGFQLDGLSLAFGAGVDVHWAAGPFSFDAHGVIMAVLTHKPPKPGSDERPWIMAGMAEIRGSVDLGPVSIGANARLDVLVQDDPMWLYGHARACASVDLWLVEIEGCVEFDIGDPPPLDVPDPQSPFDRILLTDRRGLVVEDTAGDVPTVWADSIPVITFSHWVAAASSVAGIKQPIGDAVPDNNGWIGTDQLQYRFELQAVRIVEKAPGEAETEVGSSWDTSWQLPLNANVWGAGNVPAEARALALGILDPHHRLQPAVVVGKAAGDPIGVLGRLCLPLTPPEKTWFIGDEAVFGGPNGPIAIPPSPAPRRTIDLGPLAVEFEASDGSTYPVDEEVEGMATDLGADFEAAWVDHDPEPIPLDDATFGGRLWLPWIGQSDMIETVVLRPTDSIAEGVLFVATIETDDEPATVRDSHGNRWTYEGVVEGWGQVPHLVHRYTSVGPTATVRIRPRHDVRLALVGLGAVGAEVMAQFEANEKGRKATQVALADAAADAGTTRRMLLPGAEYRIELDIAWSGKGKNRTPRSGTFTAGPVSFRVAAKGTRPAPAGAAGTAGPLTAVPAAQALSFRTLASGSIAAVRRYDETVLDRADLARYVGGFAPADGTTDHFVRDPVQVLFSVDHLPDLAAAYQERLSVVATRVQGPPDDGPPDVASVLGLLATLPILRPTGPAPATAPLATTHLTVLDAARSAFIDENPQDASCRIRRPGAFVEPLGRILPSSTYRLGVHVDAAPTGELPEPAGSHDPIAQSMFRTSRYRDPLDLMAGLGLDPGATRHLLGMALLDDVLGALPGLVLGGDHGGTAFEAALRALGLDGYRPPAEPQASTMWVPDPTGTWNLVGVLLECPEPIARDGRLEVQQVALGGVALPARYWDERRTRLLALRSPAPSGPTQVEVTFRDIDPRRGSTVRTVRAAVPVFEPLKGVLA